MPSTTTTHVLAFGDSMLTGVACSPRVEVVCLPGVTVQRVLDAERLGDLESISFYVGASHPTHLLVCLGLNDLGQGTPAPVVVEQLTALVQSIQKRWSCIRHVCGCLLHAPAYRDFNTAYARAAPFPLCRLLPQANLRRWTTTGSRRLLLLSPTSTTEEEVGSATDGSPRHEESEDDNDVHLNVDGQRAWIRALRAWATSPHPERGCGDGTDDTT